MKRININPFLKKELFCLLLLMSIIWGTIKPQSCGIGCYYCETNNETTNCLICDFENSFVLDQDGTSCVKKEISGCEVVSSDDFVKSCLKCQSGKVFDQTADSCVTVPVSNQITNCGEYEIGSFSCLACNSGYYLKEAECLAVPENTVKNCSKFFGPFQCAECDEGFFLDQFSCFSIPKISGCRSYTYFHCEQCSNSSKFVPSYLEQLQFSSSLRNSLSLIKGQFSNFNATPISTPCLIPPVQNCEIFDGPKKCKTCSKGFHLDVSGNCKSNPQSMIANCLKYENAKICQQCAEEYFIAEGECSKRTNMTDKCIEYDSHKDVCLKCEDDYFVSGELNICQIRVKSLQRSNCLSVSATSDHCLSCKEGFKQTVDLFNCFPDIENCEELEASEFEVGYHTCNDCRANFYLTENKNACLPQSVENCKTHVSRAETCQDCEDNHYYISETNKCVLRPEIPNCLDYVKNENKCEECHADFYLNVDKNVCLERSVDNCKVYTDHTNECEQCNNLFYLVDSSTCSSITATNCQTSDGINNFCITCFNLFKRDSATSCTSISANDCAESNGTTDICTKCKNLFKKDNDTSCSQISVSDCAKSEGLVDECSVCNNLKYLKLSTSCDDITNIADCQISDGIRDECKICNTNFKLDANGVCKSDLTFSPRANDPNCSEFSLTGSNHCTQCKANYDLIQIEDYLYTIQEMEELSCSKINPTTNKCKQCAPLSDSPSSGVCTPVSLPYDGRCYQLDENVQGNLKGTSNCAVCIDSQTTKDSSDCLTDSVSLEKNKIKKSPTSSISCQKNEYERFRIVSPAKCTKKNLLSDQEKIKNCFLYNSYTNMCFTCNPDSFDDLPGQCITNDETTSILTKKTLVFNQFLRQNYSNSSKADSKVTLRAISRYSDTVPKKVNCDDDAIKLLTFETYELSLIRDGYVNIGTPYKVYSDCFDFSHSDHSFYNNNEDIIKSNAKIFNCGIVKGEAIDSPFFCAQCKKGYMGKVFKIHKDNDGAPISPHLFGIYQCEAVNDLDFDVGGLDYHRNDIFTNERLTTFVSAGKCLNNKHLIYFMSIDDKGNVNNVEFRVGDDLKTALKVLQYKCVDDLNSIELQFKEKCQIFAYTPEQEIISENTYQSIPAQHCLACKPGYKAVLNNKNHIIDCVQIEGCDIENSENNKMNACMTCSSKSWVFENGTIHFDKCAIESNTVTRPLVEGCLYHDDSLKTNKSCRFCDRGYDVTIDGDCKKMEGFETCSNPSYGKFKNEGVSIISDFGSSEVDDVSLFYFFFKYEDLMPVYLSAMCYDCSEDEVLTIEIDESINECISENYEINHLFSNCEFSEERFMLSFCTQCKPGFVLSMTNFSCEEVPENLSHLQNVFGVSEFAYKPENLPCIDGFTKDKNGICQRDNCLMKKNNGDCSLYNYGYWFNPATNVYEVAENDMLKYSAYSIDESAYVTCEGENNFMVLVKTSRSTPMERCKEFNLPQEILDRYQNEIIYFISELTDEVVQTKLKIVKHAGNEDRVVDSSDDSFPALNWSGFCSDKTQNIIIENCKVQHQGLCFECEDDHFETDSNECSYLVTNCSKYSSPGKCKECGTNNFLNEDYQCVLQVSPPDNCEETDQIKSKCLKCDKGYFLTSDKQCQMHTMICEEYSPDSDECLSCQNLMYLNLGDVGECNEDNKQNCNRCEYRENPHCSESFLIYDFCKVCDPSDTFLFNNQENCRNGATSCFECRIRTSDSNCLINSFSDDGCQLCESNYYMNMVSQTCTEYTALNCEIFDSFDDRCLKCKEGLIMDEKNKNCIFIGYATCAEIKDDLLECETCPNGMVKDQRAGCIVQNVTNCTGANLSQEANTCISCDDPTTHFMDHYNNCKTKTPVDNCIEFEGNVANTKCNKCDLNFYLDRENNSCLPRTDDRDCKHLAIQVVDRDECSQCQSSSWVLNTKLKCDLLICPGLVLCNPTIQYLDRDECQCKTRSNTSILGCEGLASHYDGCGECETGKFLSDEVTCSDYVNATACTSDNRSLTADECLACDNVSSHFLNRTTKICEQRTLVQDCTTFYEDKDECYQCKDSHFLQNPTTCTSRTNSLICKVSLRLIDQDSCSGCTNGRDSDFLNPEGTQCTTRQNVSEGCFLYSLREDKCEICLNNYSLNPNNGKCEFESKSINCKGLFDNIKQVCVECPIGFHLSETGECLANTQPNCSLYFMSTNQCRVCSSLSSFGIFKTESCFKNPSSCEPCPTKSNNCYLTSDDSNGKKCLNCLSNFWYDKDSNTCQEFTAQNCQIENKFRNECIVCKENYLTIFEETDCENTKSCLKCVEKKPVLEMVENCELENTTSDDCEKCVTGFYLKITGSNCYSKPSSCHKCIQRSNTACLTFDDIADKCKTCERSTHYLKRSTGECSFENPESCSRCVEGTAKFCSTFRLNSNHCQNCIEGYVIDDLTFECIPLELPNCELRSNSQTECVKCSEKFYLDEETKNCLSLTEVNACEMYEVTSDKCFKCIDGFYYNPTDNRCELNPNGPHKCIDFNTETICKKCDEDHYLTNENVCQKFEESPVDNCKYYSSETICSECADNFWLNERTNECILVVAQNCSEVKDPYTCFSCPENHILETGNFHSNCIHSGIDNCSKATLDGIPFCLQCRPGYVLSDNKKMCSEVEAEIQNCSLYESHEFCSRCEENFYLASDRKTCIKLSNQAGSNCSVAKMYSSPVCDICDRGFYRDLKGNCIQCIEGCNFCDLNSSLTCIECESGYTKNENKKCIKNIEEESDNPQHINICKIYLMLNFIVLVLIKFK